MKTIEDRLEEWMTNSGYRTRLLEADVALLREAETELRRLRGENHRLHGLIQRQLSGTGEGVP